MNGSKHIFIIGSCDVSSADHAKINETEAIATFPLVASELLAAGGTEAFSLFSLPERVCRPEKNLDTVTWYSDLSGSSVALSALSVEEQKMAAERLRAILRRLAEVGSPVIHSFLCAALNVLTPDSIRVINGQPTIINWGMVPRDVALDLDGYADHVNSTVGPYLTGAIRPVMSATIPAFPIAGQGTQAASEAQFTDVESASGKTTQYPAGAVAEGTDAGTSASSGDESSETNSRSKASADGSNALPSDFYGSTSGGRFSGTSSEAAYGNRDVKFTDRTSVSEVAVHPSVLKDAAFVTLASLVAILLLFVVYALWPGNLIYPQPIGGSRLTDEGALATRVQIINSMKGQIAELQGLSDENICLLDNGVLESGLRVPPIGHGFVAPEVAVPGNIAPGTTPDGSPGSGNADHSAPDDRSMAPIVDGNGPLNERALLHLLDQATVFVVGSTPDGVSTGSGFFITPRLVVTNYHVVENVQEDKIVISNGALSQPLPARIVNHSEDSEFGSDDFALLEVAEPVANILPLKLTTRGERLTPVVAAGYPSFILSSDPNFIAAFRGGDRSHLQAINLAVTTGSVTAEQQSATGTRLLVHSATISPGNSGGPLSDICGRIVGVNTFTRTDTQNALRLNFALGAPDLMTFLSESNVTIAAEEAICATRPAAVAIAPAPANPQVSPRAPSDSETVPGSDTEASGIPSRLDTSTRPGAMPNESGVPVPDGLPTGLDTPSGISPPPGDPSGNAEASQ